ncbi:MAG: CoA-binding protein, partial [Carbonactinosporaceae bacterium]
MSADGGARAGPASGLAPLWNARAVAIIGATERPGAIGRLPVEFLERYGYAGRILPVNPNATQVLGVPAYPTVAAAPGPVDLALILVAAHRVPAAIEDCVAAGVPVVVVMSAGFAETGPAGAALQSDVVATARAGGIRVVGPNCIGAVGFAAGQVACFSPLFSARRLPVQGGEIGFVTQSGALGYGAVSLAMERGLGLAVAVNTGNEADVTAVEVLHELAAGGECGALLGYVESLTDGPGLRALAGSGIPVALLKAGTSASGA